ncbi:MAG: hypothetical protein R2710_12150 [Acidimicrobiales bacterium]
MLHNRRSTDRPEGELAASEPRPLIDPQWRRIVQGLLRAEFSFQNDPANAELSTVFVEDTPVYSELVEHNLALRTNGFRVVGKGPRLVKVQGGRLVVAGHDCHHRRSPRTSTHGPRRAPARRASP